jgi:hypothetical protein
MRAQTVGQMPPHDIVLPFEVFDENANALATCVDVMRSLPAVADTSRGTYLLRECVRDAYGALSSPAVVCEFQAILASHGFADGQFGPGVDVRALGDDIDALADRLLAN